MLAEHGECADQASVEGVNLEVPGSAPLIVKTWDERLSDDIVESGVDDEVSSTASSWTGGTVGNSSMKSRARGQPHTHYTEFGPTPVADVAAHHPYPIHLLPPAAHPPTPPASPVPPTSFQSLTTVREPPSLPLLFRSRGRHANNGPGRLFSASGVQKRTRRGARGGRMGIEGAEVGQCTLCHACSCESPV